LGLHGLLSPQPRTQCHPRPDERHERQRRRAHRKPFQGVAYVHCDHVAHRNRLTDRFSEQKTSFAYDEAIRQITATAASRSRCRCIRPLIFEQPERVRHELQFILIAANLLIANRLANPIRN
jgi:hypothetical protein